MSTYITNPWATLIMPIYSGGPQSFSDDFIIVVLLTGIPESSTVYES